LKGDITEEDAKKNGKGTRSLTLATNLEDRESFGSRGAKGKLRHKGGVEILGPIKWDSHKK